MTKTKRTYLALFVVLLSPMAGNAAPIQLLLETDADADSGSEIFLASFDSYADLIDSNLSASSFSQLNIGPSFSVGGFAFDGLAYQLLLETDADADSGSEIFLASFDSYTDLIDSNLSASSFSQLNIGPSFSVGGFAYELVSDPPVSVPEPSTLALLGIGLLGMGAARRRQKA